MQITCLGAAGTVTGSSYLVEMDNGHSFMVDCGLFQGNRQMEDRNWALAPYNAEELDGIFITHAHIDHSGLVPRLVRQGYRGPVYATEATCELLQVLWLDSAHIQEMEAEWQTRKNRRRGGKPIEVLYETADAEAAIRLLKPIDLENGMEPIPGVKVRSSIAGHILGAAHLHFTLEGDDGVHRVGFSGDIGRYNQLIVPDPSEMPQVDSVFMETTYGSRNHKSLDDSKKELLDIIKQAYKDGGKVIIPAFAVERSQEIIYVLAAAYRRGELPDIPVYLDSPLAIKATEIFRRNPEFFDEDTQDILDGGERPLNFPNFQFSLTNEESRKLNKLKGPAVIISASGMATAGRIKHHLKHNIWRPDCHVVIVGFQAQGTTGRRLVEGAKSIRLFREDVVVQAKIHTIGGFSAHADQSELMQWLEKLAHPGLTVYLVHGEPSATNEFKKLAQARFPKMKFHAPAWRETLQLVCGEGQEKPIDPAALEFRAQGLVRALAEMQRKLAEGGMDRAELEAFEKSIKGAEIALPEVDS